MAARAALPEDMIRRSFTASGLVAMSNRKTSIHSRLKELIFSDEPMILAGDCDSDDGEMLEILEYGFFVCF